MQDEFNVDTIPQDETSVETTQETTTVEGADNTSQSTETAQEQPKIKVKYNHEEKELSYDEAVQLAQKGMNYDKAIERARAEAAQQTAQQARDSYIAEQGYEWMGKPITTESEYKQALKEKEMYDSLQNQSLPDEVIQEIVESRREREERKTEKQAQQDEAKRNQEYQEFFQAFPDAKPEEIKPEVWEKVAKGTPLKYAYMETRFNELQSKQKILESNNKNAETATGSVTGQGETKADFISFDAFEANKNDRNWIVKNFKKINESRAKW